MLDLKRLLLSLSCEGDQTNLSTQHMPVLQDASIEMISSKIRPSRRPFLVV